ncbi:MAG: ABC transporter permease [Bryobacteraceae bacterium]|jgi:lipopolysaccharide transport system permease protein
MTPAEVRIDEQSLTARVRLRLVNTSEAIWSAEEGYAASYQVFDAESDILVKDGPRVPLPGPLAPGESCQVDVSVEFPSEPGRYRAYVSPIQEHVSWFYERGAPFLVLEVEVERGRPRLTRSSMATLAALRRRKLLRALGRAFKYPLTGVWRNRSLIRSMVRRDIVGRYRGSFGGLFWTVLNPLLLMATYFFVFGIVLRARFHGDPSRAGFVLYFLCGMLPWLAFSEAAGRAPFVMLEHRNFVKKLVFPLETLPVNLVAAGLVTELFALGIFLVFLLATRGAVPLAVLWLPAWVVPQVLFTAGVVWFLAALGVYVRDLGQVNGFLLTLWFFLTPICYPVESLPREALAVLSKNPFFVLVHAYRQMFLEGRAPAPGALWKFWALSLVVFFLGHACFYKLRKNFADVI